jgi:hypothetical protein
MRTFEAVETVVYVAAAIRPTHSSTAALESLENSSSLSKMEIKSLP